MTDLQIRAVVHAPFENTDKETGLHQVIPPGVRRMAGSTRLLDLAGDRAANASAGGRRLARLLHAHPGKPRTLSSRVQGNSAETYRVEPYAVAAGIYSEGDQGLGAGAGPWVYGVCRLALFCARRGGHSSGYADKEKNLHFEPFLPPEWAKGFTATPYGSARRPTRLPVERGEPSASIDGQPAPSPLPLRSKIAADGEHTLHIRVATMT